MEDGTETTENEHDNDVTNRQAGDENEADLKWKQYIYEHAYAAEGEVVQQSLVEFIR